MKEQQLIFVIVEGLTIHERCTPEESSHKQKAGVDATAKFMKLSR